MCKDCINLNYVVDGEDFAVAGEASSNAKKVLSQLGISPDIIRKVAIAMYEGEINMVIHAMGGEISVEISVEKIFIRLKDKGPGIPDVQKALTEGFSTASDQVRQLGFGAGMGLPNMMRYTDEFKIDSVVGEGTTIEMAVYL